VPVAAGMVLDVGKLAALTPFDYSAQGRSPAGFNGLHQLELVPG
jgi:hypothetical protein